VVDLKLQAEILSSFHRNGTLVMRIPMLLNVRVSVVRRIELCRRKSGGCIGVDKCSRLRGVESGDWPVRWCITEERLIRDDC